MIKLLSDIEKVIYLTASTTLGKFRKKSNPGSPMKS